MRHHALLRNTVFSDLHINIRTIKNTRKREKYKNLTKEILRINFILLQSTI